MKTEAAHVANEYRLSTAKVSLRRKRGTLAAVSVWLLFMLATLLQRGSYALEDRSVKAVGLTSMKPKGGVRIRLTV